MKQIQTVEKELKVVKISDLKPYFDNPRHNNKSAKVVAESIKEYGYLNPILVTEDNMVLAGHTRLKAMKLLKQKEIEVLVIKGLTEKQKNGFVIADNRVGEFSTWNFTATDRLMHNSNVKSEFLNKLGMGSVDDTKAELEALING